MSSLKSKSLLELFEGHPGRWCQKALARDASGNETDVDSPAACRWCIVGGAQYVYGTGRSGRLLSAMQDIIGQTVASWQNAPERVHSDVVELCRTAEARCRD